MTRTAPPLDELRDNLLGFVDQSERPVLVLTSFDEEVLLVAKSLDTLDAESESDVVVMHTAPVVGGAAAYVESLVETIELHLREANEARAEAGHPPLAPLPRSCSDSALDPYTRARELLRHVEGWLPPGDGHRFVLALLPEHIADREAHARVLGALVPFRDHADWPRRVRLVVRDDRADPFVVDAMRKAGVSGPYIYTTRLTVNDFADATAEEAADAAVPPARRMNALLQCATFDVAYGRYEDALDKFGVLYTYYEEHRVPELQVMIFYGIGDVMTRIGRPKTAQEWFIRGLELATQVRSLPLILQMSVALADLASEARAFAEAETGYALGAEAARKMLNLPLEADLLEKCGVARAALGNLAGAVVAWNGSAQTAREIENDERLASVLTRLRQAAARAGHHDVAARFEDEQRDANARLALRRAS